MSASNKKILIISGICFLASLAVIILLIAPAYKRLDMHIKELAYAQRELAIFDKKTDNLKETKEVYDSWQLSLEKIKKLFIDTDAPINFIKFLEKASTDSNLVLNISSTSSDLESSPWPSILYQINVTGSFSNLIVFLKNLEAGPYLIDEQALNIKRLADGSFYDDISAVLKIKVYTK